jgi:glutamate-1-semialdehyde 2,1-aminomutase
VICEPVNYNSGCITPRPGYLQTLREQATKHGVVLIFDEVLSGFRMAPGGAQAYYSVTPDLCTLAKAVANGLPLAVVAGKRDLMQHLSPVGPAAHSGTYTGHLFSVLAGLASLEVIRSEGFYDRIFSTAERLYSGLTELFARHGVPARVQGLGARFGIFFGITDPVWDYQDAVRMDAELMRRFMCACFDRGVYFHNYGRIAIGHHGLCAAHTAADVDETLERVDAALSDMARA